MSFKNDILKYSDLLFEYPEPIHMLRRYIRYVKER